MRERKVGDVFIWASGLARYVVELEAIHTHGSADQRLFRVRILEARTAREATAWKVGAQATLSARDHDLVDLDDGELQKWRRLRAFNAELGV